MTDYEVLAYALNWYMGMYGCTPRATKLDDTIEYSCNGYVVEKEEAVTIAKARDLIDFWE